MISGIPVIKLVTNVPTLSPRSPAIRPNVDKEGNNHFADISTKTRIRCTARKPKKRYANIHIIVFPIKVLLRAKAAKVKARAARPNIALQLRFLSLINPVIIRPIP